MEVKSCPRELSDEQIEIQAELRRLGLTMRVSLTADDLRLILSSLPFSRDEMKRNVKACDEYGGKKRRIKAFVLTTRYTGLRIGDAIRLSRSQGADPNASKALAQIENGSDRYFWTGKNIRSSDRNGLRNWCGRVGVDSIVDTLKRASAFTPPVA